MSKEVHIDNHGGRCDCAEPDDHFVELNDELLSAWDWPDES